VRKGARFAQCNAGLALRAVVRSLAGYNGLCKRVEIVDDCVFDGDGIEISTLHSELMRIDIFKAVEFNCPFVVNPLPDGNFSIH
jgi:hypothetical protein